MDNERFAARRHAVEAPVDRHVRLQDRQRAPRGQGGQPLALRLNDQLGGGGFPESSAKSLTSKNSTDAARSPPPNVEVTGRQRRGAWAARRNMDNERFAAQVPCRWRSG
jgi:hypothetical protein